MLSIFRFNIQSEKIVIREEFLGGEIADVNDVEADVGGGDWEWEEHVVASVHHHHQSHSGEDHGRLPPQPCPGQDAALFCGAWVQ